jgi:hypothetical protein
VLADLILMAPSEDQGTMIADILRNLGQLVLEKDGEMEDEGQSAVAKVSRGEIERQHSSELPPFQVSFTLRKNRPTLPLVL